MMEKLDTCRLCERQSLSNKRSGIYLILNEANQKVYIGSSNNIHRRLCFHNGQLQRDKHYNAHLQSAWNKYGSKSFSFYVLEICDEPELEQKEEFYISKYSADVQGYNKTKYAYASMRGRKGKNNPLFGKKRPVEIMRPMREANCGIKHYNSKKVLQITPTGDILKTWDFIADAAKSLNADRGNITKSCKGQVGMVKGFFWRYADDPNLLDITVAVRKA